MRPLCWIPVVHMRPTQTWVPWLARSRVLTIRGIWENTRGFSPSSHPQICHWWPPRGACTNSNTQTKGRYVDIVSAHGTAKIISCFIASLLLFFMQMLEVGGNGERKITKSHFCLFGLCNLTQDRVDHVPKWWLLICKTKSMLSARFKISCSYFKK